MKSLDRRWIFLSIGLVVFVFLRVPFKVRYSPTPSTTGYYEALKSLPTGSIVFLGIDYGPDSQAELRPMHEATVYQLLKHGVRVIAASVWETGPPLTDAVFDQVAEELAREGITKTYGVDYVNLGYKAGQDVAIAKLGTSIPETFPADSRGTRLAELPILRGVRNFDQIVMLCDIGAGVPGPRQYLQQIQLRYKVRMLAGATAVSSPDLYAFFQSRQLEGFLGGLVGAAEYEYLLDRPGRAMAGMNVQSLAHFLIIGFVVVGNILYYLERRRRKGGPAR